MNTQQIAQQLIDNDTVVIDTETTGLGEFDYVLEIGYATLKTNRTGAAIVRPRLFDLVSQESWETICSEAYAIHGISYNEVRKGVDINLALRYPSLGCACEQNRLAAFNAAFDQRLINQTIMSENDESAKTISINNCVMELANRHLAREHAEWNEEDARFKRLSLERCCKIMGVKFEGDAHRALTDAMATAALVHAIANDKR